MSEKINAYSKFDYVTLNNYIKIEITENFGKTIADAIISLKDIPKERFFCNNISLLEKASNIST